MTLGEAVIEYLARLKADDLTMRLVLTVNAGSSSVRFGLAEADGMAGRVIARSRHEVSAGIGDAVLLDGLGRFLGDRRDEVVAVAHRVVHGGAGHFATRAFDAATEADVAAMTPLAPLHNPSTLQWLQRCRGLWPRQPQLAVFDSGFFAGLPPVAATYALPSELARRWGLRRLGFHGLAHRSMWQRYCQLTARSPKRVVTFQLGNGSSAAALLDGRPVDTSMGFTPLEGLVMGTRSGDVDPGLLLYLLTEKGVTAADLTDLLNEKAGLAGLSGRGGDMRVLLASDDNDARLAVDLFCYRARKYLGAYLAALGGCDAVLLGGGIAESAPRIRQQILGGLERFGLTIDPLLNAAVSGEGRISEVQSPIEAWVISTDEETVLAEEAAAWLDGQARTGGQSPADATEG